jgi:transaldolase
LTDDIRSALSVLRPVFDESGGADGFVSVEVAPELAHDTAATCAAARPLHQRIDQPNLFVKIPATAAGIPAIRAMISEGHSINITLIFSLARYAQVIEAYLAGLQAHAAAGGDTEVDRRLEQAGTGQAQALLGQAAVAQAKLAYQLFRKRFAGRRWQRLVGAGARLQRPLWASTSVKNPSYRDTRYVDDLIGPDTVNTLPEATIRAFEEHGVLARTLDVGTADAEAVMRRLAAAGVDMDDVGLTLEREGMESFTKSFEQVLTALDAKARQLPA